MALHCGATKDEGTESHNSAGSAKRWPGQQSEMGLGADQLSHSEVDPGTVQLSYSEVEPGTDRRSHSDPA